jgi:hypothetical protein
VTCVRSCGLSNPARFALSFTLLSCARIAAVAALALAPLTASAHGAVLRPAAAPDPSTLDVEVAVAVTPFGTTRWTRLTVAGPPSVLWLVPARPGAALDYASEGWLTALEAATSPRIIPPSGPVPPCPNPSTPERVEAWSSKGAQKFPRSVTVHATASDVRAYASAQGYVVPTEVDARIGDLYALGYALVSLELDTASGAVVSSPTLRVSDDGAARPPLALTGSTRASVRVTAIVIGASPAQLPGARELDPSVLSWGRSYSDYASARSGAASGNWLRESASHSALFDGIDVPRDAAIEPLAQGYFREANGQLNPTCEAATRTASRASGSVGRACPAARAFAWRNDVHADQRSHRSRGVHVRLGRRRSRAGSHGNQPRLVVRHALRGPRTAERIR